MSAYVLSLIAGSLSFGKPANLKYRGTSAGTKSRDQVRSAVPRFLMVRGPSIQKSTNPNYVRRFLRHNTFAHGAHEEPRTSTAEVRATLLSDYVAD